MEGGEEGMKGEGKRRERGRGEGWREREGGKEDRWREKEKEREGGRKWKAERIAVKDERALHLTCMYMYNVLLSICVHLSPGSSCGLLAYASACRYYNFLHICG